MSRKVIRSPRLARKVRRKKGKKILMLICLALFVAGGVLYLLSRAEFRITRIEVSGFARVSEERIREVVRKEISGAYFGFIPKAHTLFYPRSRLTESLRTEFPVFSDTSISLRSLASLHVAVREREPKALWCSSIRGCFLIDETGFVFAKAEAGTEEQYYRLEQETVGTPLGTTTIESQRLSALLVFLTRLDELGFRSKNVLLKAQSEVNVVLADGSLLLLREGAYERALASLETLVRQNGLLPKQGGAISVSYIDLRYGNKIYFKPR